MAKRRVGKLPPRYSFVLNPYMDTRLSKCPECGKLTHSRKFVLFIHIDEWGPMALGKTCRYCSRCELIIVHQNELEAQLAHNFSRIAPNVVGNEYMVLGTVAKKAWEKGLGGKHQSIEAILKHTADFKRYYDLEFEPGGWYSSEIEAKKNEK